MALRTIFLDKLLKVCEWTKTGDMCVWKISLYMGNPRTFTSHILPLLIKSRKRLYYVDKIKTVICFNFFLSVYWVSESVIKKLWILLFIWHWEQLSIQRPHWAFYFRTPINNFSGDICGILFCSTQASIQSLAEVVVLSVYIFASLYSIKSPRLRPALQVT